MSKTLNLYDRFEKELDQLVIPIYEGENRQEKLRACLLTALKKAQEDRGDTADVGGKR